MIRKLMIVLAMILVATFALAQAQSPSGQGPTVLNGGLTSTPGGFAGSGPNNLGGPGLGRHDLQNANNSQPIGCESCHLPHTAPTWGTTFLWAWRNLPTNLPTYQTPINSGGALLAPPLTSSASGPTGNSRSMLCFSCHDGTSASANGVIAGVTFNGTPYPLVNTSGGTSLGLESQHPVDAIVPTTGDYVQPVVGAGWYESTATIGIDALPLWDSVHHVECGTCHDVHNDYTSNGTAGGQGGIPFLRQSNINGTYLCRECHNQ